MSTAWETRAPALHYTAPEPVTFPEEVVADRASEIFLNDTGTGGTLETLDSFSRGLIGAEDMKERLVYLRKEARERALYQLADEWSDLAGA